MKVYIHLTSLFSILIFSVNSFASSLALDSKDRGINETCQNYLGQIEQSYGLNGLNMTFAHPQNPSKLPSLHISTQLYNNGSSSFSATLTPHEDNCYVSATLVTSINNQSCSEITEIKLNDNNTLQISSYADGDFTILTPNNNAYQIILTSFGENSCTMTETRMLWPGS